MRSWIARWLIDRAIDDDREPPAWVCRLIERDAELREYARGAKRTVRMLRGDAEEWVTGTGSRSGETHASRRSSLPVSASRSLRVAVLLAAAVLIAATIGFLSINQPRQDRTIVDGPVAPSGGLSDEALSQTTRELAELLADRPGARIASMTVKPAEAAGRFVGRSLAMLDRSLEQERGRLRSDAESAVQNFAEQIQTGFDRIRAARQGDAAL